MTGSQARPGRVLDALEGPAQAVDQGFPRRGAPALAAAPGAAGGAAWQGRPGATAPVGMAGPPVLRRLGVLGYGAALEAMRAHLRSRRPAAPDEIWWLEHEPVYTLGLQGARGHVHAAGGTPVLQSDRGGHVTWHGPGQLVVYTLVDLRRRGLGIREFVALLEQAVIDALAREGRTAARREGAPGVYVEGAKIASLGLRVSRGISYHGLALNVENALEPFAAIDPCGVPGLAVTRTCDLGLAGGVPEWAGRLEDSLIELLPEPIA